MAFPWYLHAAANIYQRRQQFARATTAYYTYKTARKTMGFLRGSNQMVPYRASRPYSSSKPTTRLATELKALHRKINKQKPETKHWFYSWGSVMSAGTTSRVDLDLTDQFHADASFRDNVLGDKWRNLKLDIRMYSETAGALGAVRLIVYKPKRPGSTWPGITLHQHIDPNDYTVLLDKYIPPYLHGPSDTTPSKFCKRYIVNLRNTITSFDTAVRKGEIKVAVMMDNDRALTCALPTKFMLSYQNM